MLPRTLRANRRLKSFVSWRQRGNRSHLWQKNRHVEAPTHLKFEWGEYPLLIRKAEVGPIDLPIYRIQFRSFATKTTTPESHTSRSPQDAMRENKGLASLANVRNASLCWNTHTQIYQIRFSITTRQYHQTSATHLILATTPTQSIAPRSGIYRLTG